MKKEDSYDKNFLLMTPVTNLVIFTRHSKLERWRCIGGDQSTLESKLEVTSFDQLIMNGKICVIFFL